MRVRPLTVTRPRTARRPHVITDRPAPVVPAAEAPPAERRHRECVAPQDNALYACSCGFAFEAAVSTSVACPHCGTDQAW
jgi:hypothetical protein